MVPETGTFFLNVGNINELRSKDRLAAEILRNVGIVEINWIKNDCGVKEYMCPSISCKARFVSLFLLKGHFYTIHNDRPYKCPFGDCSWTFSNKSRLYRHKISHLNLKWFKCSNKSCGKNFTTMFNLQQHLKNLHGMYKFFCTIDDCGAGFRNKRSLELHRADHKDAGGSYRCDEEGCNKTFLTKNALSSHMRCHMYGPGKLKCTFEGCDKVFDLPCRLKEHIRYHTGEKPYRCDHPGCGWTFYTGSKLRRHLAKHSQIRRYPCTYENCDKTFFRSQHLKGHMLVHAREKLGKYPCPEEGCNAEFYLRRQIYEHMKEAHKNTGGNQKSPKKEGDEINIKSERSKKKKKKKIKERLSRYEMYDEEEEDEDDEGYEIFEDLEGYDGYIGYEGYEGFERYLGYKVGDLDEGEGELKEDEEEQQLSESPNNESINPMDSINLLTEDFDESSIGNVPLTDHIPDLVSSELLVSMNSIESPSNESLAHISPLDSCISQQLVKKEETNNNELCVINDNSVSFVFDHTSSSIDYNNIKQEESEGSARTDYIYTGIINEKSCKAEAEAVHTIKWLYPAETGDPEARPLRKTVITFSKQEEELQDCKFSIPSDLVLGPGINDNQSLIVQNELYTQEDLQVLLLDQNSLKNPIFEHSTINLRDLE